MVFILPKEFFQFLQFCDLNDGICDWDMVGMFCSFHFPSRDLIAGDSVEITWLKCHTVLDAYGLQFSENCR